MDWNWNANGATGIAKWTGDGCTVCCWIGIAMRSDTVALECEQGTGAPIQVAEVHCNTPINGALAESIAIRTDEFFTLYGNTATWTAQ